jgi:hypothetical protein
VNASVCARCEWATLSHSYLFGEMRVGEMIVPGGVWTPIMSLPNRFHGDVGGTRDAYGHDLGMESLSGSPSSCIIWKRSICMRLVGRAGEDGGGRKSGHPSGERGRRGS